MCMTARFCKICQPRDHQKFRYSTLHHTKVITSQIQIQPFPEQQILDSSKLKEFADSNFNFDENGRKFFKQVENTVGKREIARFEQFLLFPRCFQKICTADT